MEYDLLMGLEDEIRDKLLQGYAPQQLIQEGFRKSTVYKVYNLTKFNTIPVTNPDWVVEGSNFEQGRYLPGQNIPIGFRFGNTSRADIYLYRIGVQTEWMRNVPFGQETKWIAQDVRELVKAGTQRWVSLTCPIPKDLQLGEYGLSFGVEGQYLPATNYQAMQTQWSDPSIIHVKKPLNGLSLFLSHSTLDMSLVRELENRLDNEGIKVNIAEDRFEPGVYLQQKFQRLIGESTMLLALLTENGVRSKRVIDEVNYAASIKKPMILLKEENVVIASPLELVRFSRNNPPELTLATVMNSIKAVQNRVIPNQAVGALVGITVLAFLAAALSGSSSK